MPNETSLSAFRKVHGDRCCSLRGEVNALRSGQKVAQCRTVGWSPAGHKTATCHKSPNCIVTGGQRPSFLVRTVDGKELNRMALVIRTDENQLRFSLLQLVCPPDSPDVSKARVLLRAGLRRCR